MDSKVYVITGTYNRGHLLARSLECYSKGTVVPAKIFVIDDDSTDNTSEICRQYSDIVEYIKLTKPEGITWRDSAAFINMGIKRVLTLCKPEDVIICTHPEVMPGPLSIQHLSEGSKHNIYLNCKPYYLTPRDQEQLDTAPWREVGAPEAARMIEGFYEYKPIIAGGVDYSPKTIEASKDWESWVFGGMTALTWKKIGGMSEHNAWGSIDVTFHMRRHMLGILCSSMQDRNAMCVHQNHDTGTDATPRDMKLCMQEAHGFKHPIEAIYNNL
jgi:GT2 family glycosyltransferase